MPDDIKLSSARIRGIVVALVAAAVLYLGKAIFLPIAASILLCFVLSGPTGWLERRGLGRPLSVIVLIVVVFGCVSGFGWLLFSELVGLSEQIPKYKATLVERVHQLQDMVPNPFAKATETFRNIEQELSREVGSETPAADQSNTSEQSEDSSPVRSPWSVFAVELREPTPRSSPDESENVEEDGTEEPVKVDVVSLPPTPLQELAGWFGPLVNPLGALTMVIILTIFMLAEREDFRNRMVRLLASSNLAIATTAITEATYRTALWLRMMCLINAIYAAVIGAGLYLLGMPSPFVWAVAAFFFRFIPFIGGWMCALVPILLSFAVFEDWLRPLAVIALYVLMDFVVNSILEPWLYGRPIGLTSVGVILAVIFWAWMWGLVGLLLAVPITLWLVVLGRYVPQLNAFTTLLGDSSDLPSYHTLYQRLLAYDSDEALTIWDQLVEDAAKRAEAFDEVLLPLMQRAAADHRAGFISDTQLDFIAHTIGEGLNELTAREAPEPPADEAQSAEQHSVLRIFVQPLHSRLDHLAARYLALELARQKAGNVAVGAPDLLSNDLVQRIGEDEIDVFIISGLRPLPNRKGALLVKKLNAHFPDLSILRAFWDVRPAANAKNGVQEVVTVEQMSDALGAVTSRKQRSQSNGSVAASSEAGKPVSQAISR